MQMRLRDVRAALAQARALVKNYHRLGLAPTVDLLVVIFGCRCILKHHRRRRRRRHRTAHLGLSFTAVEKRRSHMADPITIGPTQDVLCELHPTDGAGNPTRPTASWSTSDPSVIVLEVAADTLSARGVSVGPGTATIHAATSEAAESGAVTVSGITPPPPPASLGLTFTAVEKGQ